MGNHYYKYTEQDLHDLQQVQLGMMRDFDAICREHDIPYFLLFGTALGAVRHGGFIPWDDDVDIGMMRSDYKRLKQVFLEHGNDINSLMTVEPSDNVPYHENIFPRIYKKGTVFHSEWSETYLPPLKEKKGVWLDLFLFDFVDSPETAQQIEEKSFTLHRRYFYRKFNLRLRRSVGLVANLKTLVKKILHFHAKLHWTPDDILNDYYKLVGSQKSGEYIVSYDSWEKSDVLSTVMRYDDYFPVKEIPFCGENFLIMNRYDRHLTQVYGDYMQLPPEDKRVNHPPHILDLNDGKGDRIAAGCSGAGQGAETADKGEPHDADKKPV